MKISVSRYTLTSLLIAVAVVVAGLVVGEPNLEIFAFPVNVILMALWLVLIVELYRRRQSVVVARYLLSSQATIFSLVISVALTIWAGLQAQPATTNFTFVVALLFVMTQVAMVTLRGWRNGGGVRWLFLFSHSGLLLALSAGVWGAPDSAVLRMKVGAEAVCEAVDVAGHKRYLDYDITLSNYKVDYYDNGTPSEYRADVVVADKSVVLRVNEPYSVSYGEDIYLVSFDMADKARPCVLQIVRQPWRGVMVAGVVMLIVSAVLMFLRGPKR